MSWSLSSPHRVLRASKLPGTDPVTAPALNPLYLAEYPQKTNLSLGSSMATHWVNRTRTLRLLVRLSHRQPVGTDHNVSPSQIASTRSADRPPHQARRFELT
jgi:hypothetical protein